MAAELANRGERAVARPLKVLVPLIRAAVERGNAAGVEYFRQAGIFLLEAKEQLAPGEFKPWVKRTCGLEPRRAYEYMQLATELDERDEEKCGRTPVRTMQEVIRPNKADEPAQRRDASVREELRRVNYAALATERQAREREERLMRELGLRLINIGYKVLATQLHPDHRGGSTEAMERLNRVRTTLRDAL